MGVKFQYGIGMNASRRAFRMADLFVAEGVGGVQAREAERGESARDDGHEDQQNSDGDECEGVGGCDAPNEALQKACCEERQNETAGDAGKREENARSGGGLDHIGYCRAKREANAHLAGALHDGLSDQSINSERGEKESQAGER